MGGGDLGFWRITGKMEYHPPLPHCWQLHQSHRHRIDVAEDPRIDEYLSTS